MTSNRPLAFVDTTLSHELHLIATNITGTAHIAKRVVRHMVPDGQGRILSCRPFRVMRGVAPAFALLGRWR